MYKYICNIYSIYIYRIMYINIYIHLYIIYKYDFVCLLPILEMSCIYLKRKDIHIILVV